MQNFPVPRTMRVTRFATKHFMSLLMGFERMAEAMLGNDPSEGDSAPITTSSH